MTAQRKGIDWEAKLDPEEKAEMNGKTVVLLNGLKRLADEAGLIKTGCQVFTPATTMVQCVFTAVFEDGTSWEAAADATAASLEGEFRKYPTAIAQARAQARCLKDALGIRILSAEEIGFGNTDASPNKSIDANIVRAIEQLCTSKSIDVITVINESVEDPVRASQIAELSQLTTVEGQRAMAYLNEAKPKAKISKRAARKAELEAGEK
jgi:hypothetical protein